MKKVLVLCTGNSCRSQMAEAYLAKYSPGSRIVSAGIEKHGLNPRAVAILKEDGIDISDWRSKTIDEVDTSNLDIVITVCDNARESCPVLPGNHLYFHHSFPDPAKATGTEKEIMDQFRSVRDAVKKYCGEFAVSEL